MDTHVNPPNQCQQASNDRPRAVLTALADRLADWRFFTWYWGDAIAVDGLVEAELVGDGQYRAQVVDEIDQWWRNSPDSFDDVLAPGATILRLVSDGDLPAGAGERVLRAYAGRPQIAGCIPILEPHRHFERFGVCIDAVYHLPATMAFAARWRDDDNLARDAVRIAVTSMQLLECKAGWAQWYDAALRRNNGVAWSRGLGWAVLGLLDLIDILDGRRCGEVEELASRLLLRLADTQQDDGHWAGVLDHPAADGETSTACFYVAAALHPRSDGIVALPSLVLARAIDACYQAVAVDGTYTGVTVDVLPSWDISTYEHPRTEPSPWSQGAAVRALVALVRSATKGA